MTILFDTNVVLDVLLDRPPHAAVGAALFTAVHRGTLRGLLGATTITTIHYLAQKTKGDAEARKHIEALLSLFEVAPVDRATLRGALHSGLPDHEDAVLYEAAQRAGADGIVTRDSKDFSGAKRRIYSPVELLSIIQTMQRNV